MKLRPTILDVARVAGVSTATVSRALHEPKKVSPDTADRVRVAVRDTGYTLNIAAQTLRAQRANALLVIVPNIANTFYGEVLAGIEAAAAEAGQTILIGDTGEDGAREAAYLAWLRNGRADGAMLFARPSADWADVAVADSGLRPVVMISEPPLDAGTPSVTIDHADGAEAAVAYLIGRGHRRIAHVTGPASTGLTALRLAGYRRALGRAGLPETGVIAGDFTADSGARAAEAVLRLRPGAVFCANDEMAMGLIGALARAGVRVPQDISVMGFDDIHFAPWFVPALTTIRQPRREIGVAAVRMMNRILGREEGRLSLRETLPFTLVERDSVASV